MTERTFDPGTLELLSAVREVRIRTEAAGGTEHRTIIWIVVDEGDRVLVRSYRGPGARWYREALSGRMVALVVDGRTLPVVIEPASDDERVASCSRELERKYADEPETPEMLADELLETTLELRPA